MNVFIIAAPYQILNAIEAVYHFNLTKNVLVILYIGLFKKNDFEVMLDKKHWDSIKYIDFVYQFTNVDFGKEKPRNFYEKILELYLVFDQFIKRRKIDKFCNSIKSLENLFLGNYLKDYDLHMRHIANKIHYQNLYLLDVGTDTLRINRQRVKENIERNYKNDNLIKIKENTTANEQLKLFSLKAIKRKLRNAYVDWNAEGVEKLTYFTSYDFEVNGEDRILKNSYEYSKSVLKTAQPSEDVLFLGQPLIDQGYLTIEVFVGYMRKIKNYFQGDQLFYVPHPRESDKQIKIVQDYVGIKIKRFSAVIEYEIAFSGKKPRCIASFFTSAIENCSIMFGNSVDFVSFYLPRKNLLKDHEVVEMIYCSFKSGKFKNLIKVISPS